MFQIVSLFSLSVKVLNTSSLLSSFPSTFFSEISHWRYARLISMTMSKTCLISVSWYNFESCLAWSSLPHTNFEFILKEKFIAYSSGNNIIWIHFCSFLCLGNIYSSHTRNIYSCIHRYFIVCSNKEKLPVSPSVTMKKK